MSFLFGKPRVVREAEAAIDAYMARRNDLIQKMVEILPAGHPLKVLAISAQVGSEHRREADREAA